MTFYITITAYNIIQYSEEMKRAFLIAILMCWGCRLPSQSLEIYDGYLGNTSVAFFLNIDKDQVIGYYVYNKFGRPILLTGEIFDGQYRLKEYGTKNGKKEMDETAFLIWNRYSNSNGRWSSGSRVLELSLTRRKLVDSWEILNAKVELKHTLSGDENVTYPIVVRMNHPIVEDGGVFNILMSDFFDTDQLYKGVWPYFNTFVIDQYRRYLDFFSEENYVRFSLDLKGNVVFVSESLLVYCLTGYAYSGGAHGQPLEEYSVYSLTNLTKLRFSDIFREGSEYALAEIIRSKDVDKHDIKNIQENLDNFYLTDTGVGFVFNPYDIDCYACGTFEFFIGYEEIKHLLR